MARLVHVLSVAVATLLLGGATTAQVAQSSGYLLQDFAVDAGGGGTSSVNYAAHLSFSPVTGGEMGSAGYTVGIGFLQSSDPMPSNLPVVFGVSPPYAPKATGGSVLVSGLNFTKFGVGPSVTLDVGGASASGIVPLSNTMLQATFPPGQSGPQDVVVGSSYGSTMTQGAFVYTPAVTVNPVVALGSTATITNYGDPPYSFISLVSPQQTFANSKFGTLLIGPDILLSVLYLVPYPGPDGIFTFNIVIPNLPILMGATLYWQSLTVFTNSPLTGEFTNAQSMLLQ